MTRGGAAGRVLLMVLGALVAGRVGADEGGEPPLSLADLAPYRAALEKKEGASAPARAVTFRELWDHPDAYRGRRVGVEGGVVRRFRQGAFGTFPPLTEVWAVSAAGDPFCLVFPTPPSGSSAGPDPAPGASVRFEGVFLRRLRYQGGDADRLAPLIVGDRPPAVTTPAPPKPRLGPASPGADLTRFEWTLGLLAAAFVALILARRHLRGPSPLPSRPQRDEGPPPEFVDRV